MYGNGSHRATCVVDFRNRTDGRSGAYARYAALSRLRQRRDLWPDRYRETKRNLRVLYKGLMSSCAALTETGLNGNKGDAHIC